VPENEHRLRSVSDRLYGGDQEHRITQEILAGIGGVRAIRAVTAIEGLPAPEVFHMNEGHAGFLGVERIRELITESGLDFDTALAVVRSSTVFTTHTPVPAGIDRFPADLVRRYFDDNGARALLPGVPTDRIIALGAEHDPEAFNMAHMGLRLAQRANGVSRLHGRVSRVMFNDLWHGFDPDEVPIGSITNGVHGPSWAAPQWLKLGRELAGSDSLREPALREPALWQRLQQVDAAHLWRIRSQLRAQLVDDVRVRLRRSWLERGAADAELGWIATAFDPEVLTIGFARRVPTYKRLTLMLRDPDRLERLLLDDERPIQFIVAGKSHPADDAGKALIQQVVRFADRPEVRHRIAFLPDYDMSMARLLYWGCDVWLNNPLRPLEACGTSGMKCVLNGGLNLSIRDGWWDEWYDGENGWEIPSADGVARDRRDDLEAGAFYDLLERSVAPKFYERDHRGLPPRWIEMVRHTLQELGPKVLASRMVSDYVEHYYRPAAQSLRRTVGTGAAGGRAEFGPARKLAAYRRRAEQAWPKIHITDVDSTGLPDTPLLGSKLTLTATVQLAGLRPNEVIVQAVLGRVDARDALLDPVTVDMTHTGTAGAGKEVFSTTTPLPVAGAVGYTVRVLPQHPMLAAPNELGLVTLA
jgi:starch phosphorylase